MVGVNGAGKTTFIGKLCTKLHAQGKRVLVGAADTFRAGAIDQLRIWAERTGAEFVGGAAGSDPAATAFNAVDVGVQHGVDVVVIDTAGRLHTSGGLMDELKEDQPCNKKAATGRATRNAAGVGRNYRPERREPGEDVRASCPSHWARHNQAGWDCAWRDRCGGARGAQRSSEVCGCG